MTSTAATQNILLYGVDGGNVILFVAAIPTGEKSKLKREPASVTLYQERKSFRSKKKF